MSRKDGSPMACDLHVHSTYSDGRLDPLVLLDGMERAGCLYGAITDHDCYRGSVTAAETGKEGMVLIPGAEIDTREDMEVLVYGWPSPTLWDWTERICRERREVAREIVRRIDEKTPGVELDFDAEIGDRARGSIMKPHLARLCQAHGLAEDFLHFKKRLYEEWCPDGVPAHEKPFLPDVLTEARAAGCKTVLAHPLYFLLPRRGSPTYALEELMELDVDGYEFYYIYEGLTEKEIVVLDRLNRAILAKAEQETLLLTGGSDFHGLEDPLCPDCVPEEAGRALAEAIGLGEAGKGIRKGGESGPVG